MLPPLELALCQTRPPDLSMLVMWASPIQILSLCMVRPGRNLCLSGEFPVPKEVVEDRTIGMVSTLIPVVCLGLPSLADPKVPLSLPLAIRPPIDSASDTILASWIRSGPQRRLPVLSGQGPFHSMCVPIGRSIPVLPVYTDLVLPSGPILQFSSCRN
jgi:hypothetical protein